MQDQSSKPTSLSKKEYEILAEFKRHLRFFLKYNEESAEKVGLKPQQYLALLAIIGFAGDHPITIGELAEQLLIQPHSAGEMVKRLEQNNLVTRKNSSDDGRMIYVSVTPYGMKIMDELAEAHREELEQMPGIISNLLKTILQDGRPDP
jgi:DNA-binding MarR family transcriptional regulator